MLGRITYTNNGFLIVNGTVGVEFRDAGDKEEINPIFGIGATYQVREGTTLALTSEREGVQLRRRFGRQLHFHQRGTHGHATARRAVDGDGIGWLRGTPTTTT